MKKNTIPEIIRLLRREYGNNIRHVSGDPVSVLVQTILSQNTSDLNSGRAFDSLMDSFGTWDAIATAPAARIAESIKSGGLSDVKARYIKQTLLKIKEKHRNINLDFLIKLPIIEAREWLLQLPGVGVKTANCVLLFSLGMPALPIDTHVFRVAKRMGLIPSKSNIEQAQIQLEKQVADDDVFNFHVLLIEHGRKTCKAQRPLCGSCVLNELCPGRML
jgi:endonuclease III